MTAFSPILFAFLAILPSQSYLYNSSGENNLRKSLAREVRKKTVSEAETLSNWKLRICNIIVSYLTIHI